MRGTARSEGSGVEAEVREGGALDPEVLRQRAQALRREELSRLLAAAAAALGAARRLLGERVSRKGAASPGSAAARRA